MPEAVIACWDTLFLENHIGSTYNPEIEASIHFLVRRDILQHEAFPLPRITFDIDFAFLLNPQVSESHIHDMLTDLYVPSISIDLLKREISMYAFEQALLYSKTGSSGTLDIYIRLHVNLVQHSTIAHEDIETMPMGLDEDEDFRGFPASRSSIEALKIKKFHDTEEEEEPSFLTKTCMICMDEYMRGVDIIKLPCLHLFHARCIIKWLEHMNTCPLCRFPMPAEEA